jgi:hypothetical protein
MINGLIPPTDGGKPRRLTPQEMADFNKFLDYVKQKGLQGSDRLNHDSALRSQLFSEFSKANPGTVINEDIIPSVQLEHQQFAQNAKDFAQRKGGANADSLYNNESKIDGIFGSKTSQQYFVPAQYQQFNNGTLVKNQNLGLMNGLMEASGDSTTRRKPLPKGAKLEKMSDGHYYYEGADGDMVLYQ